MAPTACPCRNTNLLGLPLGWSAPVPVPAGYEAETVAQADRSLKDALGPLAYVVAGGWRGHSSTCSKADAHLAKAHRGTSPSHLYSPSVLAQLSGLAQHSLSASSSTQLVAHPQSTQLLCAAGRAGAKNLVSASNFEARVTVDGQQADGEVAAITIANTAPPFSVLAHGHTGECIYDGEHQWLAGVHHLLAARLCGRLAHVQVLLLDSRL